MRKGIVILLMTVVAGGMIFASGDQEENVQVDRNNFQRGGYRQLENCPSCGEELQSEEVTLTGTVSFTAQGAVLDADGEEWLLMYPQWALADVELESGDEITVSGYDAPFARRFYDGDDFREDSDEGEEEGSDNNDEEHVLRVTSAVIDGVEYELFDGSRDGFMGRGGRDSRGGRRPFKRG